MKNKTEIIPMTFDKVFKKIMKEEPEYTKRLIHLITGLDEDLLSDVTFHDTELPSIHKNQKRRVADIFLTSEKVFINLESNRTYHEGIKRRNILYFVLEVGSAAKVGSNYKPFQYECQINFNAVNDQEEELINEYQYFNTKTHQPFLKNHHIYNISLEKLKEKKYTEGINQELVRLLKMMYETEIKNLEQLADSEVLEGVLEKMKEYSEDEYMIGAYNEEEERERMRQTEILMAKEEGEKKGFTQGVSHGISQGKSEQQREIAKNMLAKDMEIKNISEITGLTIEEIEGLK